MTSFKTKGIKILNCAMHSDILSWTEDAHCFTSANESNASINYSFRAPLSGISDHALNGKYILLLAQAGIVHHWEPEGEK